jgi:Uma2 family endonuclease
LPNRCATTINSSSCTACRGARTARCASCCSATFRREAGERGLEPDECYSVGEPMREYPDIALEIIVTSGGIDKLEVYRGLGVREVWMWRERGFQIFVLGQEGYGAHDRSALVPDLDFAELAALAELPDQHAALKEYRARLRAKRG